MAEPEPQETLEHVDGGELVYRAYDPAEMHFRQEGDGAPVLEGRMMPYDEWAEVNSPIEGHFMERFAPGSLAKTLAERAAKIRVLFEHGLDSLLGTQAIAALENVRDETDGAYYRASLLDGLPRLLVAGMQKGLYGTSIRFKPVKWDRVRRPQPSDANPDGLEQRTIREGFVKELSVVTFPQYAGATAVVRSMTDEIAARQLMGDPERLLELIARNVEPQHSDPGREPQEDPAPPVSRRTQPVHDYLQADKGDPEWKV